MTEPAPTTSLAIDLSAPEALRRAIDDTARRAAEGAWAERAIGRRDASAWSGDPSVQAAIADRLGWLEAPFHFADEIETLTAFGSAIKSEGFEQAVLGGMGGSSLAPALLAEVFAGGPGIPVRVLDSTDPQAVAATLDDLDPLSTLFIVSTKSGTTAESLSFEAYQWQRVADALKETGHHGPQPGDYMVAVTDPGKSADSIPHHDQLRELFLNPPDVGGRYSALTYVGLVPGALLGMDLEELLERARNMVIACGKGDATNNPGLALGIAMGTLAANGRDKLTFVMDRELATFGAWVEQLIAESTGKHGVGIVPVDAEPLGTPGSYGNDRVFVRISLAGSAGPDPAISADADAVVDALAAAGHPVIRIEVGEPIDLGAEFVRWEVATAISGIVLGIDPFDQPNVEEAKSNTRAVLAAIEQGKEQPKVAELLATDAPLSLYGDASLRLSEGDRTVEGELRRHIERLKANGYVSLQAYIAHTPERDAALRRLRTILRDRTGRATTVGYGPRFLHSTGQLHKGGAPLGWFIQLTSEHPDDREIPGKAYTFGQLIDAQAAGDFQTIESHDLPIVRIDLGSDPDAGLAALEGVLARALMEA